MLTKEKVLAIQKATTKVDIKFDFSGSDLLDYYHASHDHLLIISYLESGIRFLEAKAIWVIAEAHPVTDVFVQSVRKYGLHCDGGYLYYIIGYLTELRKDDDETLLFLSKALYHRDLFARGAMLVYLLYASKETLTKLTKIVAGDKGDIQVSLYELFRNAHIADKTSIADSSKRKKGSEDISKDVHDKINFMNRTRSLRLLHIAFLMRQGHTFKYIQSMQLPEDNYTLEAIKSSSYVLRKFKRDIEKDYLTETIISEEN